MCVSITFTSFKSSSFNNEKSANGLNRSRLNQKDRDAFKIMELELTADWAIIQKRFKTLVKKLHPDRNAGNKLLEDKLKKITMAYSHLKFIIVVP